MPVHDEVGSNTVDGLGQQIAAEEGIDLRWFALQSVPDR
jgi:hypothetical protein